MLFCFNLPTLSLALTIFHISNNTGHVLKQFANKYGDHTIVAQFLNITWFKRININPGH